MENPQSYTNEFKSEAVKLVLGKGLSEREAAKRLSMPKGTLSNWVRDAKGGKAVAAPGARSVPELEAEVEKLRKDFDSVVLCCGATQARDLPIEGRDAAGIHPAMEFLTANTRHQLDQGSG